MTAPLWMIRTQDRIVLVGHNAIADYRAIDPAATVKGFDMVQVEALLAAAKAASDRDWTLAGPDEYAAMKALRDAVSAMEITA